MKYSIKIIISVLIFTCSWSCRDCDPGWKVYYLNCNGHTNIIGSGYNDLPLPTMNDLKKKCGPDSWIEAYEYNRFCELEKRDSI